EAAEMALLRVIHASEMPDPGALLEKLASGETLPARSNSAGAASGPTARLAAPANAVPPQSYEALVTVLDENGERLLSHHLHDDFRVVHYDPPLLKLQCVKAAKDAAKVNDVLASLRRALKNLYDDTWQVELSEGQAEPSLRERQLAKAKAEEQAVLDSPMVKAAFEAFPGAELAGYTLDEQRSA
ncbi:MAG TPA: DNA polymerase III subunit gamma/tau, partial [Allosphingosinicella sp.]